MSQEIQSRAVETETCIRAAKGEIRAAKVEAKAAKAEVEAPGANLATNGPKIKGTSALVMSNSTAGLFLVDRSRVLEQILFKASIPIILAYILQNSLQTVSILIVGRSSLEALSVAAFSYMFAMATTWLIGMGGTTGIDTLASPSFTGSNDKQDLCIILQRAPFISTLF
ncbi:ethionine resistance protein [Elasticomyces elasticus]|nr:ethionine resistance protein [Elasticomyces elasticus]